jgi:hypothetical protein
MDIFLRILIGAAAAFALFWTIRTKKTFPAIISLGMIVSILLLLFPSKEIQTFGLYIYTGFVALAFIHGLTAKNKEIWPRIVICLMAFSIFVYWLWVLNHWHGNEVLAPIFALIIGLSGIISKAKLKNELGFLVILTADAVAIIIEHIMKAG